MKIYAIIYISNKERGCDMKVTRIFELTPEEKEHISYTARFFRTLQFEMDNNIEDRLEEHFAEDIADKLTWFLKEFEGKDYYTLDIID